VKLTNNTFIEPVAKENFDLFLLAVIGAGECLEELDLSAFGLPLTAVTGLSFKMFSTAIRPGNVILKQISGAKNLHTVNLSKNQLSTDFIELFCTTIKEASMKIKTLKLAECSLGNDGANKLASYLSSLLCELEIFDISNNSIKA
jgi:hypothetical protein